MANSVRYQAQNEKVEKGVIPDKTYCNFMDVSWWNYGKVTAYVNQSENEHKRQRKHTLQ